MLCRHPHCNSHRNAAFNILTDNKGQLQHVKWTSFCLEAEEATVANGEAAKPGSPEARTSSTSVRRVMRACPG